MTIFYETTQATSLLFADSALQLIATLNPFAKISEFVLFIEKYLGSPKCTEFMNICVNSTSALLQFDWTVYWSTFDSQFLVIAQISTKCTYLFIG